ncbi:Uncharacterized protein Rs2_06541 [Raphanus sativus]|nr:Uncharacterized protein Rs2_06541 [Raphanus sativus]
MAYSDVVLAHSPLTLSASVDLPRSCWSSPPFLDSKNQEARRVVVYLSLCDDEAAMFRGLINSGDRSQSVMVVTTVNPKIFGGTLYFTTATKLYFYPALQAIAEFTARMWGEASRTARNKVRGEYKEPSPTTLGGKKNILKRPCE